MLVCYLQCFDREGVPSFLHILIGTRLELTNFLEQSSACTKSQTYSHNLTLQYIAHYPVHASRSQLKVLKHVNQIIDTWK